MFDVVYRCSCLLVPAKEIISSREELALVQLKLIREEKVQILNLIFVKKVVKIC